MVGAGNKLSVMVGVLVLMGDHVIRVLKLESLEPRVCWVMWEVIPLKVWGRGRTNLMVKVASPVKQQSMDRASMVAKNLK